MSDMGEEILELAARTPRPGTWGRRGNPGKRYVRTPEGAEKYGLPIGALITRDAVERAKARGRNYTVPEDDKRFGSQAPAAGRTRRNASEIVAAIRNAPAPRVVTPDGPKKIAIGGKGYGFPEGSRAFRAQKHQNFAIVRTPDYQLVGITDRGIAFELDGELERELNEELDDDQSKTWLPDEPNPNLGASEESGVEVDAFRPDNVEDMPGYLSDEQVTEILSGLEQAGVDQNSRNATELQLQRNNDRIREEFDAADAPGGPDGTEDATPVEDAPALPPVPTKPADEAERIRAARAPETIPAPTPERQPEPEEPRTETPSQLRERRQQERRQSKPRQATDSAPSSENSEPSDDEQLSTLEELTRSRPTGVAEGEVNGKRVTVRRNRVNDAMEYSAEDEQFQDRDALLENTRKRNEPEEPRDTTGMEPSELSDQELDDVLADIDDALRTGAISRREARARRVALAAERNNRTGDAPEEPEEPEQPEVVEGQVQPGEPTTREWAESAQPGAAAQTSDGVLASRTDDGWETPLGRVQDDFLSESDVVDDDAVVVRNAPETDNRPVGATQQISSPEDLEQVRPLDGVVVYQDEEGNQVTGVRRDDSTFDLTLPDGLVIPQVAPESLVGSGADEDSSVWHVPNQDLPGTASRESWSAGDTLSSLEDLAAQKNGTRLRYRFRRPGRGGATESTYSVQPNGKVRHEEAGTVLPGTAIKPAILQGRVSVIDIPERDIPDFEIEPPRVVENLSDYVNGDAISDYRHLRDMAPGSRVTLVVPASQNGGREAQVVLTRTRDEADLGGFMFLVGNGGRGYNSFGENNASLFQAIHDGRLHFGDIKQLPDAGPGRRIGGDWSRDRNISLWEGGPDVSEYDLRTFIASQVASTAMQGSYYDTSLLPDDSPFRSRRLRDEFSRRAIEQYSTAGNPARHKPAMIRLAAEKLGMEYTDPGSTLIPDNLTLEDFNTRVTLGRWLRSTGTSAEANMGPEQLDVTRADIKTALAVLDNMQLSEDQGDPDKILKRVFARQGSPLQDLNVAVAIASYFRMRRFKDGSNRPMTTIARQYNKRRNRELLRQMLREQLEGREPGYYGVPEDETYERNGVTYHNRSSLGRPQVNATTDENPNAIPTTPAPAAPEPMPEEPVTVTDIADEIAPPSQGWEERRFQFEPNPRYPRLGAQFRMTSSERPSGGDRMRLAHFEEDGSLRNTETWKKVDAGYESVETGRFVASDRIWEEFDTETRAFVISAADWNNGMGRTPEPEAPRTGTPMTITGEDLRDGDIVLQPFQGEATPRRVTASGVRFTPSRVYTDNTWYRRGQQLNIERPDAEAPEGAVDTRTPQERRSDMTQATRVFFDRIYPRHQRESASFAAAAYNTYALNGGDMTMEEYVQSDLFDTQFANQITPELLTEARQAATDSVRQLQASRAEIRALDEQIANESQGMFYMAPERRDALDDFDRVQDAYLDARNHNDVLNYINSVMGEEGVAALNSGDLTMRQQFTNAWEQSNGVTPEAPASDGPQVDPAVREVLDAEDGAVFTFTRGNQVMTMRVSGSSLEAVDGPQRWARNQGTMELLQQQGNVIAREGAATPEAPATPERPVPRVGESVEAARISDLPVGSQIDYTRVDGLVSRYTRREEGWFTAQGNPTRTDPSGWNTSFQVVSAPGEASANGADSPGDPRFIRGGSFRGRDIREAPVGAHIRGSSGREYRVTETGIRGLGTDTTFFSFEVVARNNANFSFEGDSAPEAPVSAVGQTMPDTRVGSTFSTTELMSLPTGGYVRSTGGTVWQLNGSYMTSTTSGTRRRIRNLREGRYTFLGTDPSVAATATGRPARTPAASRTLEQAGLSRVPQAAIERYDRPRPIPNVLFDTSDTTPWDSLRTTPAGREQLREGLTQALRGALPEGSTLSVSVTEYGFTASYATPSGANGSMTRSLRSNGRIENAVAHAGGANFSDVQDHLFAFYRQHGLTEVEVHGLSGGGDWNGAHTWVRRGFRPDPTREVANFNTFSGLRDNLSRIIRRTENGDFPAYVEFLAEARDLSRRMTDLLNERQNLSIDERNDRLYKLWRELTYLAEVRKADGTTARGQRQSIGWRLLGTHASSNWYYGLRPLNDYFQN